MADALYAKAPFFNFLIGHGKQVLVVLKEELATSTSASHDTSEGEVSIAGLPVVGCVGFDFLAAGEHTSAGRTPRRNLRIAPSAHQTGVSGEGRMDVGDDLTGRCQDFCVNGLRFFRFLSPFSFQ